MSIASWAERRLIPWLNNMDVRWWDLMEHTVCRWFGHESPDGWTCHRCYAENEDDS